MYSGDAGRGANLSFQAGPHRGALSGGRVGRYRDPCSGATTGHSVGRVGRDREQKRWGHPSRASAVAKSAADGYTLFATGMETFAITPFIMAKISFDPDKDFTPVSGLGFSNQFLVMTASSPLMTVGDVIAAAKAKPGDLQYGTIGLGGSSHINMVLFESMAGIKLTPVHYRGGAPLVNDLLGGHVPMAFLSGALVDQGIKSGRLRASRWPSPARCVCHNIQMCQRFRKAAYPALKR